MEMMFNDDGKIAIVHGENFTGLELDITVCEFQTMLATAIIALYGEVRVNE